MHITIWKILLYTRFCWDGFVIVPSFGNPDTDIPAKSRIENYFPNRDVHLVDMLSSWAAGGGIHCHTNDQPAFTILKDEG